MNIPRWWESGPAPLFRTDEGGGEPAGGGGEPQGGEVEGGEGGEAALSGGEPAGGSAAAAGGEPKGGEDQVPGYFRSFSEDVRKGFTDLAEILKGFAPSEPERRHAVEDLPEDFRFSEKTPEGRALNRLIDETRAVRDGMKRRETDELHTYIADAFDSEMESIFKERGIVDQDLREIYESHIVKINPPSADERGHVTRESIRKNLRSAFDQAHRKIDSYVKRQESQIAERLKKSPPAGPPSLGAGGAPKPREPEKQMPERTDWSKLPSKFVQTLQRMGRQGE